MTQHVIQNAKKNKWRGTVTGGAIINKYAYRYTYTMLYTHTHYTSIQTCPHTRKELDHWSDPSGTESQNVVLGLAASHFQKLKRFAGTSGWLFPISQSQTTVFVGQWMERDSLPPPAFNDNGNTSYLVGRSFTSVQMFHTHTRPEPGQPWKARGRKKRTPTTGQRTKQRRGNKRTSKTNLHGETDLTSTEHTPKPHDALQRGTGDN